MNSPHVLWRKATNLLPPELTAEFDGFFESRIPIESEVYLEGALEVLQVIAEGEVQSLPDEELRRALLKRLSPIKKHHESRAVAAQRRTTRQRKKWAHIVVLVGLSIGLALIIFSSSAANEAPRTPSTPGGQP